MPRSWIDPLGRQTTLWTIRFKRPEDASSLVNIARTLPEWFNADGLARMERDLATHEGLVTLERDDPIAFATYAPAEEAGVVEMTWLAVKRERHDRGVGSALCYALESLLRKSGCRAIVVSTLSESIPYPPYEATRRFYLRRGYRRIREDREYWGPGNDRLLLRLDLGGGPV